MEISRRGPKSIEGYAKNVDKKLDEAFARAEQAARATTTLDLAEENWIVFSDIHRGARNDADDFERAERAYNAALAYYFQLGHTLVILGDSEELWEERARPVLKAYRHSFALELAFHLEKRYMRVWGNHDDEWMHKDSVEKQLASLFEELKSSKEMLELGFDPDAPNGEMPELRIEESLLVQVQHASEPLGRLFMLHGHQGDTMSDDLSGFSRHVVRYVWRPIQRLANLSPNTPARRWDIRDTHNEAMYAWAVKKNAEWYEGTGRLVLIAGHTHRPVFRSLGHEERLAKKAAWLRERSTMDQGGNLRTEQMEVQPAWLQKEFREEKREKDPRKELAAVHAELEWVRAQAKQTTRIGTMLAPAYPCYFNTGCGCYSDGDVTGIEIADRNISLIRFPDDKGAPAPKVLETAPLKEIFVACTPEPAVGA